MAKQTVTVPDIGGAEDAEVIELCVGVGDHVEAEQGLIVLESDKASMEIPASAAGTVVEFLVKEGDSLGEGDAVLVLEVEGEAAGTEAGSEPEPKPEPEPDAPVEEAVAGAEIATAQPAVAGGEETVVVPDIGSEDAVEVIEISVSVGDAIEEGDSLLVLESDKATMEIPAPASGAVLEILVKEGDQVRTGDAIARVQSAGGASAPETPETETAAAPAARAESGPPITEVSAAAPAEPPGSPGSKIYAGPAVRKLAREFGIDLRQVTGSGPRNRIVKEDLHAFVKGNLGGQATGLAASGGAAIMPIPQVDFSKFGEVDVQPLTKMDKVTAANMQRSWLNVPHVTQFDEADITSMEAFRKDMKAEAERRGVKLTPLPFLMKACAAALRDNPRLNSSLAGDGENIVYKQYVHIGMAVDTPAGLVVPVLRDVDRKGLWELAEEITELASKAKHRKLKPNEMQGGCFTISSLGNIGGTGFTPIVNAPEVAILGVSKAAVKPVWDGGDFQPRTMLPLCLSYDHRVVNGGDGGRFMSGIVATLGDIRRLLL